MNNVHRTICAAGLLLVAAFVNAEDPARKLEISNVMTGKDVTHAYYLNGKIVKSLTIESGDDILVILKDLNPLLFDIKIEGETIAAPKDPNPNPFSPGILRATNKTSLTPQEIQFLNLRLALVSAMTDKESKPLGAAAYATLAKNALRTVFSGVPVDKSITSETIKDFAKNFASSIKDASTWDGIVDVLVGQKKPVDPGLPAKGQWDAKAFDAWTKDLGEFVDEINKLGNVQQVVTVKLNDPHDGFAINVSVKAKTKVHGIDIQLEKADPYSDRFVVKAAEPAKSQQGAAAFLLSFVRDNTYVVDAGAIARKGGGDYPGVAVGYLYHTRAAGDRVYFSFGAASSDGKALSYLGGFSWRMGDKRDSGFLTFGFIASQVTVLDGVFEGQAWTDPKIPTKKSYRYGFAFGFSVSVG